MQSPARPAGLSSWSPAFLLAGALLLLGGDLLQVLRVEIAWTILLGLAFLCFGAGLLLLPQALSLSRPLVTAGILCAFVGCFAGAGMQVLFRASEVLRAAGETRASDLIQSHRAMVISTLAPGILFPIGLLALAIGLPRSRVSLSLALGAILFPIGHAVGFAPALLGGDLVLLLAFLLLFLDLKGDPRSSRFKP